MFFWFSVHRAPLYELDSAIFFPLRFFFFVLAKKTPWINGNCFLIHFTSSFFLLYVALAGDNEWHWTKTNIPSSKNFLLFSLLALVFIVHICFFWHTCRWCWFFTFGQMNTKWKPSQINRLWWKVLHSNWLKWVAGMGKVLHSIEIDTGIVSFRLYVFA